MGCRGYQISFCIYGLHPDRNQGFAVCRIFCLFRADPEGIRLAACPYFCCYPVRSADSHCFQFTWFIRNLEDRMLPFIYHCLGLLSPIHIQQNFIHIAAYYYLPHCFFRGIPVSAYMENGVFPPAGCILIKTVFFVSIYIQRTGICKEPQISVLSPVILTGPGKSPAIIRMAFPELQCFIRPLASRKRIAAFYYSIRQAEHLRTDDRLVWISLMDLFQLPVIIIDSDHIDRIGCRPFAFSVRFCEAVMHSHRHQPGRVQFPDPSLHRLRNPVTPLLFLPGLLISH